MKSGSPSPSMVCFVLSDVTPQTTREVQYRFQLQLSSSGDEQSRGRALRSKDYGQLESNIQAGGKSYLVVTI